MTSRWSQQTKLIVTIFGLVGMVWVLFRFASILLPLITALILTYLINRSVGWLTRRTGWPRTFIVIVHFLGIIALIVWGSALLTPRLIRAAIALGDSLTSLINELSPLFTRPIILFGFRFDLTAQFDQILNAVQGMISPLATEAVGVVVNIASGLFYLILVLVLSFYLVKDTPRIMRFFGRRTPPAYRHEMLTLWREMNTIWDAYFRGQLVLMVVIGVTVWVTMTIVGVPNALALGVIAGALEVIPNFGPVVAAIPGILLALTGGSSHLPQLGNEAFAVLVTLLYIIIQQLENHFIVPRVIGTRINLHPVVVIMGTLGGAQLAGVLGVFLAAPVIASVRVLFSYAYAKVLDMEPFAQPEPPTPTPQQQQIGGQTVRAILFDLDGTLVEPDEHVIQTWENLLRPLRWLLPRGNTRLAARRVVLGLEGPFNRALSLVDAISRDSATRLYRWVASRFFSPDLAAFRPVVGAAELVRGLSARYGLGLVTTRTSAEVAPFLAQTGLGPHFKAVITRDTTRRLKPHPLPIRRAAELLGVPVAQCVVVGDGAVDIEAARNAGALAIGVLSGFGTADTLAGADVVLDSVAQLADWL